MWGELGGMPEKGAAKWCRKKRTYFSQEAIEKEIPIVYFFLNNYIFTKGMELEGRKRIVNSQNYTRGILFFWYEMFWKRHDLYVPDMMQLGLF